VAICSAAIGRQPDLDKYWLGDHGRALFRKR
jgi:hypothetical protein